MPLEAAKRRFAEQLHLVLDAAQMGWWQFDPATGEVQWDQRIRELYDIWDSPIHIDAVMKRIHPDDHAMIRAAIAAATNPVNSTPYHVEYRILQPDGSLRWLASRGHASFEGEGPERKLVSFVGTVQDVSSRKQFEMALKESAANFRELADAMPQIVFAARPDGHVDYFNRRWYEYTGLPMNGQTGDESWVSVHEPEMLSRIHEMWLHAVKNGHIYEIEYRLRRHDGAWHWHLGRAVPIRNDQGEIVRWFGTNTDIHEQKMLLEQNQSLLESERAARSEAERIGRIKDEFLATLSHELRTPLSAILGWALLLKRDGLAPEDISQGIETIERNARAQAQLIDDLLDMNAIIAGKIRLDVQRVDLPAVINAAITTVRHSIEAKQIALRCVADPMAGPITGDPNRLQQVVWNLLSNAIKFTPARGKIEVVLERVNSHIEISVSDTGIGIAANFLPHVFDRFRQADASTSRRHGGLGLGLAIVKQLVELHGGSIYARSPGEGQGATFCIHLPMTIVLPPEPEADANRRHPTAAHEVTQFGNTPSLAGVTVLVVDDESDARELVARLLTDQQAEVLIASSAAESLSLLDKQLPDVIVSDIGMPGTDGYSLMRQIRARGAEDGGNIPAAALTAFARAEDRTQALLAGFQTHVAKPVEPAELLATVATLAGKTGRTT